MHGTQDDDHPQVQLGTLRTKHPAFSFEVEAGKSYEITYKLAGNNIASYITPGTVRVKLLKASDNSQYESVDATHTASAWDSAFTTQTVSFTAGATETVVLQLESSVASYITGVNGTMNVGPKIDDVMVRNVTDDIVLFEDDFEDEVNNSGVVSCPTPDPADSKAAIALASMSACEKLAKIAVDFPQNLYDVASFEFNAAGSGFSACLKAWICNPTSDLVDTNGLLNGLRAYWAHDEASGDVVDSHTGNHDLTETGGTLASNSGKKSGGRAYGLGEVALAADGAWNNFSATDCSFAGWFMLDSVSTGHYSIITKGNSSSSGGYHIRAQNSGPGLLVGFDDSGATIGEIEIPSAVVNTWYFFCVRRNVTTGLVMITVGYSGSLVHSIAYSEGTDFSVNPTGDNFVLGGVENASLVTDSLRGALDEIGIWERYLSDVDVEFLYNGGTGRSYSEFTE
jgi:hypothetical protein